MPWQLPSRVYWGRVEGRYFRLFPDGILWGTGILEGRILEDGEGSAVEAMVRPRLRVRTTVLFGAALAVAVTAMAALRPRWYEAKSVGEQVASVWGFCVFMYLLAVAVLRGEAGAARRDLVRLFDAEGGAAVARPTAKQG